MSRLTKLLILAAVAALLAGGAAALIFIALHSGVRRPLASDAEPRIIEIPRGIGSGRIGSLLESEGIIRHRYFWYYHLWRQGKSHKLQAGEYELSASMTIPEIAEKLMRGDVVSHERRITIPEGFTIEEIEARLNEHGFSVDVKKETAKLGVGEGYLFPDTYILDKDATGETIVARLKQNFDAKMEPLRLSMDKSGRTLREIITMASFLEEEIPHPEDLPLAAGVLWKRLDAGMPLQVDATVLYAKGIRGGHGEERNITSQDLRINSSYNTYLHKGLPPGAICNPGISAIRAALSPAPSEYWYYLSKPDGATVFSRTIEEHNKAKAEYLR